MNYSYNNCIVSPDKFAGDERFEQWCSFSFSRKMIEIYGEAARLTKWVNAGFDKEEIESQWNDFARLCGMSFADPELNSGIKNEIFYAYKDVWEYTYSDEPICKTRAAAMKWFEQWTSEYYLSDAKVI